MRKLSPFFNSLIVAGALLSIVTTSTVQAATHHHNSMTFSAPTFSPFAESAPKFSGFFANLGLAFNMLPGVAYTDKFTPTGVMASDVDTKASATNYISGLIKLGYAFRLGETGYLGVAGFYNLSGQQKNLTTTYQYAPTSASPVTISNTATQNPGYGLVLMPGILLDRFSLLYLNVGAQLNTFKVETVQNNVSAEVANPVSTSKSGMSYLVGIGYQHQMSFLKSREARNLMWFTELNYGLGKVNISQSITPPEVSPTSPARAETYAFTPNALQVAVGISYYF